MIDFKINKEFLVIDDSINSTEDLSTCKTSIIPFKDIRVFELSIRSTVSACLEISMETCAHSYVADTEKDVKVLGAIYSEITTYVQSILRGDNVILSVQANYLMPLYHRAQSAWITKDDVYTKRPKNFTGVFKKWNENGQLASEYNFKKGKHHGLYRSWYDTGQLEYAWNYKDGKCHGLCRKWNGNGQLGYEENYKDGELIESP